ncbi:hypothetical protein CSING_00715 [Corynebacterium singulare]|uniref:Uncharacterized protein n=1 Tax=Corynebacterium singulare TaxID=161899 RepID=A0A0B6EZV1_9CORY|nr:hypothetical protein CSING_00715 [Corynebacterium singulare]
MFAGETATRYAFLRARAMNYGEVYTFVYGFHFCYQICRLHVTLGVSEFSAVFLQKGSGHVSP